MIRPIQILALSLIAAVAFSTLGPPSSRPHLQYLGQNGEHALAFAVVGLATGLAFPKRPWRVVMLGVLFTGLLELAQFAVPGRHARLSDFIVDAAALCFGLGIAAIGGLLVQRAATATV